MQSRASAPFMKTMGVRIFQRRMAQQVGEKLLLACLRRYLAASWNPITHGMRSKFELIARPAWKHPCWLPCFSEAEVFLIPCQKK